MSRQIFINLPVKDLEKSKAFFGALGFPFNPQFTDGTAACVIMGDSISVMLLTHPKFMEFSPNPICDAAKQTEVLNCLSCESRGEVDDLVDKAIAAGGRTHEGPMDYGFMYARSFQDLDGHCWELMWMNPNAVPQG